MEIETVRPAGWARVLLAIVLLAIAAPVAWIALSALWHFPQPVYLLSPARLLVTLGACATALYGLRLLWDRPRPGLAAGAVVVPMLLVLSLISQIGVITLPIALFGIVVFVGASRTGGGGGGGAFATGLLVAVCLAVLLFASPWTAAVECRENGIRTSTRPFGSSGSSGSGVGGPGGDGAGMFSSGEASYTYRCQDGELVEFRRVG